MHSDPKFFSINSDVQRGRTSFNSFPPSFSIFFFLFVILDILRVRKRDRDREREVRKREEEK